MGLKEQQAQLFKAITLREGQDQALNHIENKGSLNPKGRLGIYQFAYRERLKECIEDDFESSCSLLGEDSFQKLFNEFVSTKLSDHWNINAFNLLWHDFIQKSFVDRSIKELCQFEWMKVESFFKHYRKEQPLHASIIISAEHNAKVRMDDSVSLKKFSHSVYESEENKTPLIEDEQNLLIWTDKFSCDAIKLTNIQFNLALAFLKRSTLDEIINDMSLLSLDDAILAETIQSTVSLFMEKKVLLQV